MILDIKDFKKAYPHLWEFINDTRIESGSNRLDEEYSEHFAIPIRMPDASLADNFLAHIVDNEKENLVELGNIQLERIKKVVQSEPNMFRWSDLLYHKNNPKGLYTDRYKKKQPKINNKKEEKQMARNNVIKGEIIGLVEQDGDNYKAINRETGEDLTALVDNQKKLKYAFVNKGCIRGRAKEDGTMVWRVVKEKFVREEDTNPETV